MSVPKKDYYDWLGVSFYASEADIRLGCESALRKIDAQIETSVPDTDAPDDGATTDPHRTALAEQRKKIMQAFMVLKDDARRKRYNASLAEDATKLRAAEADAKELAVLTTAAAAQRPPHATPQKPSAQRAPRDSPYENQWSRPSAVAATTQVATSSHNAPATPAATKPEPIDLRASMQARRASGDLINPMWGVRVDERQYAHLGVRFTAMIIDTWFVMLLGFVFVVIHHLFTGSRSPVFDAFSGVTGTVLLAFAATYYVRCESGKYRSTWGKRWMGLCVMRTDGYESVGKVRAFLRYLLRQLSAYILGIGYVMAFFSERKQALHDRLTDSVVLTVKPAPTYWLPLGVGLSIALTLVFAGLTWKAAKATVDPMREVGIELRRAQHTDPNRATPMRAEVDRAYAAAMNLQRTLDEYHRAYKRWPGRAEAPELFAKSTQSMQGSVLSEYDPRLFSDGIFTLSLGATAGGNAHMVFVRDPFAGAEWVCTPINIDGGQLIKQCAGE